MTESASIRFNNPGAMWGGNKISKKWGETAHVVLADGLGQGNQIAFFPTPVAGACAQFDLWRSSYCNMTLEAAIKKWSGGNSSIPYMLFLGKNTGLLATTMITPSLLSGPAGIALLKAQAQWEAGKPYPLGDSQWGEAQRKVFAPGPSAGTKVVVATATTVATGAVVAAPQVGNSLPIVLGIVAAIVVAVGVWWLFLRRK